jgi:hypothetical protein
MIKIDKNLVALVGVVGVIALLAMVVGFMAYGRGDSKDFVSVSEIVSGIALQIFNVNQLSADPEPAV